MKVIGITGPSGSGKSKVSQILRDNDYEVIDVDNLAREVRPRHTEEIRKAFGDEYIKADGQVDSKKLGRLVFGHGNERERLNAIMVPPVFAEIEKIIEEHKVKGTENLFFDIAVLFPVGAEKYFDKILLVTASRQTRLERLINNRNIEPSIANLQVDSVFVTHDEIAKCDLVIMNEGNNDMDLKINVLGWLNKL